MPHDVFVSYSSDDKPTADAVCATLENRGVRCWIAPRDVLPGMDWGAAIIDAINDCQIMVLVYSARANESQQIKREVERAVNRGMAVIPFRIQDVPMSKTLEYFISTPHWLDALTPPLAQHLDRLADTIALILERAGTTLARPPAAATASQIPPQAQDPPKSPPRTPSGEFVRGVERWVTAGTESPTLSEVFVPRTDLAGNVGLVAASVVAISILAQIKVGPIWLQPLAVLLAGTALGSRNGGLATAAYVALGVVGLPVFGRGLSAWSDLDYRGPYAQHALVYLIGLVAAAYGVGWLAERRSWDRRMPTAALLALIGVAVLYIPGRIWVEIVALFLRVDSSSTGVLPTVPMLVITVIIMAVALPRAWVWIEDRQRASRGAGPEAQDTGLQGVDPAPPSGSPSTTA